MVRKCLGLVLALTFVLSLPTLATAVPSLSFPLDDAPQLTPISPQSGACAGQLSSDLSVPSFASQTPLPGDEAASCWCCAKVGDATCCAACFGTTIQEEASLVP